MSGFHRPFVALLAVAVTVAAAPAAYAQHDTWPADEPGTWAEDPEATWDDESDEATVEQDRARWRACAPTARRRSRVAPRSGCAS